MSIGSNTPTQGEPAIAAEETPNKEATGLAQTPTQAPLLQQANNMGAAEVRPPVILAKIDFLVFMFWIAMLICL